jgi:hypothetical protein
MMLQAIRHHIERAAKACGAKWHPDCSAEMAAEDLDLEQRLQRVEEKAAEALATARRAITRIEESATP